jgi:hypothetical protein
LCSIPSVFVVVVVVDAVVIMCICSCHYKENRTPCLYVFARQSGVIMSTMICLNMQGDLQNGEMMVKEINANE